MLLDDLNCSAAARLAQLVITREVVLFLMVGGAGYVVDVAAFNALQSGPLLHNRDPVIATCLAVGVATMVTYLGNRYLTWRARTSQNASIALARFVAFNAIALGFSVAALWLSHDVLGIHTRLADNLSANVIGLALGTAFRYWAYSQFVFNRTPSIAEELDPHT